MHSQATALAMTLALVLGLLLNTSASGQDFPTFTDETDTRLAASAPTGSEDPAEKDYGVGDFDQDGDDDVVVARRIGLNGNNGSPLPNTLLMNEDGVLTERTAALAPDLLVAQRSRDVAVADVNGDNWLDVLVADGPNNPMLLLLNQGENMMGEWQGFTSSPASLPVGFNVDAWSVAIGDLNNDDDEYPDVFVGVRNGNDRILINLGAPMGTWLGFADESARLGANANTNAVRSVTIHDMNGDLDEDIIEGVTTGTGLRMLPNDGSGQFTGTPQTFANNATYNHALGDLNGDGILDIFAVQNGVDQYRTNDGPGAGENILLGPLMNAPATNGFGAICRVADIDASGTDDFLVCDLDQEFPQDCSRRLRFLYNSGTSPYLSNGYPIPVAWTPNGTSDVAILDIDSDNDLDLLIGHCDGNSVFTQDNPPDFIRGEVNDDGNVDIADAVAVLTYLFTPPFDIVCDDTADANDDGAIDIADAVAILGALFGDPVIPLPPPASCGPDPTSDSLDCATSSCP